MGALAAIHTVGAVGASHIERAVASVVTLAVACMRTGVRARGGERSVEGRRRRDRAWRGRRTALLAEGEAVGSGEGRQGEEDGHHRAERQEAVTGACEEGRLAVALLGGEQSSAIRRN